MKKIAVIVNVLLLFSLLGLGGCMTNRGDGMNQQQKHTFWSDQSVKSGEFSDKQQTGTYNGEYTKVIGQRRLQSSHIV